MTERDRKAVQLMARIGGGFASALAVAWQRADDANSRRLEKAFPELLADYGEMVDAGHGG